MSDTPRVRVSVGYTKNMGNYESLRYDVSIEDTVRATDKSTASAMDRVRSLCDAQLLKYVREAGDGSVDS